MTEHDHSGEPKVWCTRCQHEHIAAIPATTYMCDSCGFGQWDLGAARMHEATMPGHRTYPIEHPTVPLDERPATPTAAGLLHEIVTRIDEARYVNGGTTSPWGNADVLELLAHLRQPFTEGGGTSVAGDEHHTLDELYEYRLLYNALAANEWAAHGTYPVVKSWRHSDGEECFGGGWFIVVATLPTGQVSNHYAAEHWDLFAVPAVATPPEYDGHDPADAARRMRALLSQPTPTTDT